jgi:hypothetical protein
MKRIIGICILFSSILSCQYIFQLENDENLNKKILKDLYADRGISDFSKITDFEWDSLIILGPYSLIDRVETELNLNLTNIRQNGIRYSDFYELIVFLKNKKSVKIVELKGVIKLVTPIIDSGISIIPKDKCIFKRYS